MTESISERTSETVDETIGEPQAATGVEGQAGGVELPEHLAALPENLDELRLPAWYFGFEAVFAATYDLLKAFPAAWPVVLLLVAVNITLSLTVLRRRLKLARALWRGKRTRMIAIGLVVLRIGAHGALSAVGVAVNGVAGHAVFAVVMAAVTVAMLAFSQRTAVRALGAERDRARAAAV
ncbi:hypothetical protein [Kitasatospora viridis]|nr:hypothetical protein [Kitasatospora viridis]